MDVKNQIDSILAGEAISIPTDPVELNEIISKRTTNAKIFDLGKGVRRAKIYSCPIHYKDENGIFKSIDINAREKLSIDDLPQFEYETKAGNYHAHFKKDKPWNYRFIVGDSWIEYEALFFDESKNLDIKVETSRVGIKETITLFNKKAPTSLSWRVTQSEKSTIITPQPIAQDATGKNIPIIESNNGDILIYDVDVTGAVFPIMVDPTSVVATNDGRIPNNNADYTTCRTASVGTAVYTNGYTVGQSTGFYIWRSFASFVIPDMVTITAASFFYKGESDVSDTDFYIFLYPSTYSDPLVKEDFDLWGGTRFNSDGHTSGFQVEGWNEIQFESAGLTAVLAAKNSTLKVAIISSREGTQPTGAEYVTIYASDTADKEPYLSITYTEPSTSLSATINGILSTQVSMTSMRELKGSPNSVLTASQKMTALRELKGSSDSVLSVADVLLSILRSLKGSSDSVLSTQALMTALRELKGSSDSVLSTQALMTTIRELKGSSDSVLTATQVMTALRELTGLSESELSSRLYVGEDGVTPTNEMMTGF